MNKTWLTYVSVLLFLVLQCFLVVGILLATRVSSDSVIQGHVEEMMTQVVNNVAVQTKALLEPAEKAVVLSMDLIQSEQLDVVNDYVIERYFLSQLAIHSQFDGMYIGRKDGSFVFVNRDDTFKNFDGIQSVYRTQMIKTKPYKSVRISYRSSNKSLLHSSYNTDDFDPRSLDSYIQTEKLQLSGKSEHNIVWTEPYIFHMSNKPGITVATPPSDSSFGILGIDIELTDLSQYLETVANTKNNSSAFLKTKSNTLIAFPELESYLQEQQSESLPRLIDVKDTISSSFLAITNLESNSKDSKPPEGTESSISVINFEIEDTSHIGTLKPISVIEGQEWLLGIHAPKAAYTNSIMNRYNQSMWKIFALGLLFSLVAIPFCYAVTKPLRRLHKQATTDSLTQLYDRSEFIRQTKSLQTKAERLGKKLMFIMIDLDNFKPINDIYGHNIGDEVLIIIAKRLQNSVKDQDVVARFGGDEFAICVYDINLQQAHTILEKIRKGIEGEGVKSSQGFHDIGVTAGATISQNNLTPETLLAHADAALVTGKITQKGRSYFSYDQPHISGKAEVEKMLTFTSTNFDLMQQSHRDKSNPK